MSSNLNSALWITLIGMSLVFAAILLLWGVMALLMRVTAGLSRQEEAEAEAVKERLIAEQEMKRRAAIAAVSIALARELDSMGPHEFPLPATSIVSAWQAVMRSRVMNKRGRTR